MINKDLINEYVSIKSRMYQIEDEVEKSLENMKPWTPVHCDDNCYTCCTSWAIHYYCWKKENWYYLCSYDKTKINDKNCIDKWRYILPV